MSPVVTTELLTTRQITATLGSEADEMANTLLDTLLAQGLGNGPT